jgi:hypothetical protein
MLNQHFSQKVELTFFGINICWENMLDSTFLRNISPIIFNICNEKFDQHFLKMFRHFLNKITVFLSSTSSQSVVARGPVEWASARVRARGVGAAVAADEVTRGRHSLRSQPWWARAVGRPWPWQGAWEYARSPARPAMASARAGRPAMVAAACIGVAGSTGRNKR